MLWYNSGGQVSHIHGSWPEEARRLQRFWPLHCFAILLKPHVGVRIILVFCWNHMWAFASFWHSVEIMGVVLGVVIMCLCINLLFPLGLWLQQQHLTLVNKLQWWYNHESDLPEWSTAFKVALLIQPSSAAAERVYSLLPNCFMERQTIFMEETSVMVQYNNQ